MTDLPALMTDLAAESAEADRLVARLSAKRWAWRTPAPGWTIAHQIGHLAWTDEQARIAATDPEAFEEVLRRIATSEDPPGAVDAGAEEYTTGSPAEILGRWRAGRTRLLDAFAAVPPGKRLPWFGPPMSVASMITARIMETWAHGQDIADTLGVRREPTGRLRHVAHIGVRARDFAYRVNGLDPPSDEFRVELRAPDGEDWTWGPRDAPQRVTGSALDFCLLATRRRHPADLDVEAVGDDACRWLGIAQAFAGPPGPGRSPGQFT